MSHRDSSGARASSLRHETSCRWYQKCPAGSENRPSARAGERLAVRKRIDRRGRGNGLKLNRVGTRNESRRPSTMPRADGILEAVGASRAKLIWEVMRNNRRVILRTSVRRRARHLQKCRAVDFALSFEVRSGAAPAAASPASSGGRKSTRRRRRREPAAAPVAEDN